MNTKTTVISQAELDAQFACCDKIAAYWQTKGRTPTAYVETYGCQQNEADSEKLRGFLAQCGYAIVGSAEGADVVIMNTCAIREHAEQRVFGNLGALTHTKRRHPEQKIFLCGCMAGETKVSDRVKHSYPHVDGVFSTHHLWQFPQILWNVLSGKKRQFFIEDEPGSIAEGIPQVRDSKLKAWVSIMYGCNNFCTYCVVPYVRGRERSRDPEAVIREVEGLVQSGCRDITLLGQNVNSYAPAGGMNFASLLRRLAEIPGDFRLRFMTSHPKDASDELIEVMAENEKIARHFHLPMQSGSTEILRRMNRKYTAESYLSLAEKIKERIPDITLTTDIIVGFPGETEKDFEDTFSMVERLRFDSVFSFIFSPRVGTPAADMEDDTPHEEKTARMNRLLKRQADIAAEDHAKLVGKTLSVLCESKEPNENGLYLGRTSGNILVFFESGAQNGALYGQFVPVRITASGAANLSGKAEK